MSFFIIDRPPDDPYKRKWYFKRKQYLSRFQAFYGNSLVDGIDKAKIITVTETEAKKKAGKNKQGKMVSFDKAPFINETFPKYMELSFTICVKYFCTILLLLIFYRARRQHKLLKTISKKEKVCHSCNASSYDLFNYQF